MASRKFSEDWSDFGLILNLVFVIYVGASSDLKQATSIATHMVRDWGMSEKIGLRTMVDSGKSFQGEQLGPSTSEMV